MSNVFFHFLNDFLNERKVCIISQTNLVIRLLVRVLAVRWRSLKRDGIDQTAVKHQQPLDPRHKLTISGKVIAINFSNQLKSYIVL